MNRERRKTLKTAIEKMDELTSIAEEAMEILQGVLDEEQEAFDNLPESLQEAERGQQMQEYIETLEGVIDSLTDIGIEDLQNTIEEIVEG